MPHLVLPDTAPPPSHPRHAARCGVSGCQDPRRVRIHRPCFVIRQVRACDYSIFTSVKCPPRDEPGDCLSCGDGLHTGVRSEFFIRNPYRLRPACPRRQLATSPPAYCGYAQTFVRAKRGSRHHLADLPLSRSLARTLALSLSQIRALALSRNLYVSHSLARSLYLTHSRPLGCRRWATLLESATCRRVV